MIILGPSSANLARDENEEYHHGFDEHINYDNTHWLDDRALNFKIWLNWIWKEREEKWRKEEEKKQKELKEKGKIKNEKTETSDLDSAITKFMNLIQANITRVHIWFEDDFFAYESPYSLGILLDSLNINTP